MRYARGRRVAGRMNATEREYEQLFLGKLVHRYEAVTLRLGDDCRYTPDFMVIAEDDVVELHEVKGHWRDDAKVKIRVAAEMYPMFRFKAFSKTKGKWVLTPFGPEDDV